MGMYRHVLMIIFLCFILPNLVWAQEILEKQPDDPLILAMIPEASADINTRVEDIKGNSFKRVTVVTLISSPIEKVWENIREIEYFGSTNKFIDVAKVTRGEQIAEDARVDFVLPLSIANLKCGVTFEQINQYEIVWTRKNGCFDYHKGSVALYEWQDQTLLVFDVVIDLPKIIPIGAIQWAVDRNVPIEIKRIRNATQPTYAVIN